MLYPAYLITSMHLHKAEALTVEGHSQGQNWAVTSLSIVSMCDCVVGMHPSLPS